ncbi:MAG: hydantoinase/oxoprolinase family protein [Proteobacteria bacterium]|nr:hydantoinase/oxoprolinase family protein [Pseudomonadota bacterium]
MQNLNSLAVDIGGTFTDVVVRSQGQVFIAKRLTTPADLLEGFFDGVKRALDRAEIGPDDINGVIVHATTVVTNALIERKGGRTAAVFTSGFPDILRLRDERRYDMYDPQIEFPRPLVSPEHVFTVRERVLADGSMLQELDEADVETLIEALEREQIEAVSICFLHSYMNPANERKLAEILHRRMPKLHVTASSEVAPQIREYLRASTAAANAYAMPISQPYLSRLERRLADEKYPSKPLIMLSSGGVVGPSTAGHLPVRMVESGPAAGALGSSYIAEALRLKDMLAFDMGGTTAKVCLIQNYRPLITTSFEIDRMYRYKEGSGLPITVPCIDMIEIGSGGGSIARVDDMGLLKVGPHSAGSTPGPACYGRGGTNATVTDADVVLGAVDAQKFLGGAMKLDAGAAEAAIGQLAAKLGVSLIAAARGIFQVVCESMASAVRAHAADRGVDYRGVPLLAFGGAGPVHACGVAQLLNSRTVIFPPVASVFSAFGALVTPMRLDMVRSHLSRGSRINWTAVDALLDDMEASGRQALGDAGCPAADISFQFSADMRYYGQQHEITVDFDRRPGPGDEAGMLRERFERMYEQHYKITQAHMDIEITAWRVVARGPAPPAPAVARSSATQGAEPEHRKVHIWTDNQDVLVMPRAALVPGQVVQGPVILEEAETTLIVPPGWTARVGELNCVFAERQN